MESAGGGGVADLTFPLRKPGGETIRGQAGGLDKAGEHFDALEDLVAAEHKKARAGVDGGPAEAMVGAADESINKAHELSRRAVVAGLR